jgi:hypothetical protein
MTNNIVLEWVDKIDKNPIFTNKEKPKICCNSMRFTIDKDYETQTDTTNKEAIAKTQKVITTPADHSRHVQADYYEGKAQGSDLEDRRAESHKVHGPKTTQDNTELPKQLVGATQTAPDDKLEVQDTARKLHVGTTVEQDTTKNLRVGTTVEQEEKIRAKEHIHRGTVAELEEKTKTKTNTGGAIEELEEKTKAKMDTRGGTPVELEEKTRAKTSTGGRVTKDQEEKTREKAYTREETVNEHEEKIRAKKNKEPTGEQLGGAWTTSHEDRRLIQNSGEETTTLNNKRKNKKEGKTQEEVKKTKMCDVEEKRKVTKNNKKVFLNTTHKKEKFNTKKTKTKTKYHIYTTKKQQILWSHHTKIQTQKPIPYPYHKEKTLKNTHQTKMKIYKTPNNNNKNYTPPTKYQKTPKKQGKIKTKRQKNRGYKK